MRDVDTRPDLLEAIIGRTGGGIRVFTCFVRAAPELTNARSSSFLRNTGRGRGHFDLEAEGGRPYLMCRRPTRARLINPGPAFACAAAAAVTAGAGWVRSMLSPCPALSRHVR